MFPAYYMEPLDSLYYLVFLTFGIYFLELTLLATLFDNYKKGCQAKYQTSLTSKEKNLEIIFDTHDDDKNGHLDIEESKVFWSLILNLYMDKDDDKEIFDHIINLIDPKKTGLCSRESVLKLCNRSDFLDLI